METARKKLTNQHHVSCSRKNSLHICIATMKECFLDISLQTGVQDKTDEGKIQHLSLTDIKDSSIIQARQQWERSRSL